MQPTITARRLKAQPHESLIPRDARVILPINSGALDDFGVADRAGAGGEVEVFGFGVAAWVGCVWMMLAVVGCFFEGWGWLGGGGEEKEGGGEVTNRGR